jgi:hypothetical protein
MEYLLTLWFLLNWPPRMQGQKRALDIIVFFIHWKSGPAMGDWIPGHLEELGQHLNERLAHVWKERGSETKIME